MTTKLILATLGSFGDLHPFIAIARALRARGYHPAIATAPDFRDYVCEEGIDFYSVGPSREQILQDLKMNLHELGDQVARDTMFILRGGVFPYLRQTYDDLRPALDDAQLVLSSALMYSARFAAEKRGIPQLTVALQPMVFTSVYDPPAFGGAPWIAPLLKRLGPTATRAVYGPAKALVTRRARPLYTFRAELGLPQPKTNLLFDGQFSSQGTLATFSSLLGSVQPDYPPRTTITGFPFYDRGSRTGSDLPADLEAFIASGPAPLVFTLGTFAVEFPGPFYRVSRDVARRLRKRAILLVGPGAAPSIKALQSPNIFIADYVPYSSVFPRAAAIIHHGGIGTTGQALRAGKPQLVVPILSDQFDNAARVRRLGVGRSVPFSRYGRRRIGTELATLLDEPRYGTRAATIGAQIYPEDGAEQAARVVDDLLAARTLSH